MDILEKIRQEIAPDIDRLNALIADQLATSNPLMDNVIANYLKSKGKLIRPIIVMLSARLFGPVTDKVLRAAASVELLHNASLIHDDVVDGSTIRRGRPTVNAMWDNHIAVLVGDFFCFHIDAAGHRYGRYTYHRVFVPFGQIVESR